jgi:hypothetical protein
MRQDQRDSLHTKRLKFHITLRALRELKLEPAKALLRIIYLRILFIYYVLLLD